MSTRWFYDLNGQAQGPFTAPELKALAGSGVIGPTTWVLKEGTTDWLAAGSVRGLFTAPEVQPPPPPKPPAQLQPASPKSLRRRVRPWMVVVALVAVCAVVGAVVRPGASNSRKAEASGAARMTKAEFRAKLIELGGWHLQGITTKTDMERVFGSPIKTSRFGPTAYWYYQCADGTVAVKIRGDLQDAAPGTQSVYLVGMDEH